VAGEIFEFERDPETFVERFGGRSLASRDPHLRDALSADAVRAAHTWFASATRERDGTPPRYFSRHEVAHGFAAGRVTTDLLAMRGRALQVGWEAVGAVEPVVAAAVATLAARGEAPSRLPQLLFHELYVRGHPAALPENALLRPLLQAW